MAAVFSVLERETSNGGGYLGECGGWRYVMAVQALGKVGFNLLTQPTEITVSLFVFDKQWHTCS